MIIWRGLGFLGALFGFVAMLVFVGGGASIMGDAFNTFGGFSAAVGLLLAAGGCWFVGQYINQTKPQRVLDEWLPARRAQLDQLVTSGGFQIGPGQPRPSSEAEARAQADFLLEQETAMRRQSFNQHTLFWIPLQYIAFGYAAIVVVILALAVITVVG
ncbi:hypothetical protein ACQBAU_03385 [Propionibacteriaceae bacterium Y2011]|uniref:hypothetical protein n=1 Tax=Microlunatus sp. Y2014 TaxID=3418488 RepID=UPI003B461963